MSARADQVGQKVDRRLEAQDLFNSAWNQLRPAAQKVEGPGVSQEGEHAMGDRVDRGVMTGDEYKSRIGHDLLGDMRPSGPSSCTIFEIMPSPGFLEALDRAR